MPTLIDKPIRSPIDSYYFHYPTKEKNGRSVYLKSILVSILSEELP